MPKVKNLTAGTLHVPAAKLRLESGGVKEVAEVSAALQREIDAGRIALLPGGHQEAPATSAPALEPSASPPGFDALDEAEAVEYVEAEDDPKVIRSLLRDESRGSVIDALKGRLSEIEHAGR